MAKDTSGSIIKLLLDGVSYDVLASSNFSEVHSKFENDSIPTSGGNSRKMTRRATNREGVEVKANGAEVAGLVALADGSADFPISYTTAAGDVYRTTGWIEFENRETEDNKASLKLFPRKDWSSFLS